MILGKTAVTGAAWAPPTPGCAARRALDILVSAVALLCLLPAQGYELSGFYLLSFADPVDDLPAVRPFSQRSHRGIESSGQVAEAQVAGDDGIPIPAHEVR